MSETGGENAGRKLHAGKYIALYSLIIQIIHNLLVFVFLLK